MTHHSNLPISAQSVEIFDALSQVVHLTIIAKADHPKQDEIHNLKLHTMYEAGSSNLPSDTIYILKWQPM